MSTPYPGPRTLGPICHTAAAWACSTYTKHNGLKRALIFEFIAHLVMHTEGNYFQTCINQAQWPKRNQFEYEHAKPSQAKLVSTYLKKLAYTSMLFLIGIMTNPTTLSLSHWPHKCELHQTSPASHSGQCVVYARSSQPGKVQGSASTLWLSYEHGGMLDLPS